MAKYKKCPKCELNYIVESEEMCSTCRKMMEPEPAKNPIDENKLMVERDLIPLLKSFSAEMVEEFTHKQASLDVLGLRLPLLVKCNDEGIDCCRREIRDKAGHGRYYITSYDINGVKYHICSQWWSAVGNNSKDILKLIKEVLKDLAKSKT